MAINEHTRRQAKTWSPLLWTLLLPYWHVRARAKQDPRTCSRPGFHTVPLKKSTETSLHTRKTSHQEKFVSKELVEFRLPWTTTDCVMAADAGRLFWTPPKPYLLSFIPKFVSEQRFLRTFERLFTLAPSPCLDGRWMMTYFAMETTYFFTFYVKCVRLRTLLPK